MPHWRYLVAEPLCQTRPVRRGVGALRLPAVSVTDSNAPSEDSSFPNRRCHAAPRGATRAMCARATTTRSARTRFVGDRRATREIADLDHGFAVQAAAGEFVRCMVDEAQRIASLIHEGQQDDDARPHIEHVDRVACLATRWWHDGDGHRTRARASHWPLLKLAHSEPMAISGPGVGQAPTVRVSPARPNILPTNPAV